MKQTFIKTEDLSFTYAAETENEKIPAVKNLSVEISSGEYVAILGHNGSGKSTFAKLLNLILEPVSGKLFVDGKERTGELSDADLLELRRSVGMVFQNPDNQLVATLVEEDVAFGPENLGYPREELRKRVDEALATVGMTEYIDYEPHKLSGGQKQRVAIAGVLAMKPRCIIFDESTAMLDPSGRHEVLSTIRRLNREEGITIINITHYMNEAADADRILVINDGELLLDGTPDEVFSKRDLLLSVGLEVPQSAELVFRLREAGIDLPIDLLSTPEKCADCIADAYFARSKGGQSHG